MLPPETRSTMAYMHPSSRGAFAVRSQLNKTGILINANACLAVAAGWERGRCEGVGCFRDPPHPPPPPSSSSPPFPSVLLRSTCAACVRIAKFTTWTNVKASLLLQTSGLAAADLAMGVCSVGALVALSPQRARAAGAVSKYPLRGGGVAFFL